MHRLQQKILSISEQINIKRDGLRQIGRLVGEQHPFKVSYHIKKLENSGFIKINKKTGSITKIRDNGEPGGMFMTIPVLGEANCGIPNILAEENFSGYIQVSKKITKVGNGMLAVKASGNSMNKAKVDGHNIEDGDYVIVDSNTKPQNGDYVLAIIDDCATIKKFVINKGGGDVLALVSESTENHPDIFIHSDDKFIINGIVKYVIKKPTVKWA